MVKAMHKPHLTRVTSHESNSCSVFASQVCLHAPHVCVGPCPRDLLNTKYTHMEKALFHVMSLPNAGIFHDRPNNFRYDIVTLSLNRLLPKLFDKLIFMLRPK